MVHRMFTNFYKDHPGADTLAPTFVRRVFEEVALAQAARAVMEGQWDSDPAASSQSKGTEAEQGAGQASERVASRAVDKSKTFVAVREGLLQCCNRLCTPGM